MSNRPKVKATVAPPPKKRRSAAERVMAPRGGSSRLAAASADGRSSNERVWWIVAAVVIVVGIALIVVVATGGGSSDVTANSPKETAALVAKVTSVKQSVFDAVGAGSMSGTIAPITGEKALTADGKPRVVYIGAEYCPYCATERWAMVMALSRFGTFNNLGTSHSSGTDVYANTPTFTFHGSTFTSPYLVFDGVETESNVASGQGYAALDTPTKEEQSLIGQFDAAPYVPAASAGSIPFIDIGNKFVVSGATYSPQVLAGRSADTIAAALSDTSSDISKGAVGSANVLTAAICKITDQQPSKVCSSAGVKAGAAKLSS